MWPENPKDEEKQVKNTWKVSSMCGSGTIFIKETPSRKPLPKGDHLLGHNVNHQGETRKKHIISEQTFFKIKEEPFAIIKMTLTTTPHSFPHGERPIFLYDPSCYGEWCNHQSHGDGWCDVGLSLLVCLSVLHV
jgi:hypothetical protein